MASPSAAWSAIAISTNKKGNISSPRVAASCAVPQGVQRERQIGAEPLVRLLQQDRLELRDQRERERVTERGVQSRSERPGRQPRREKHRHASGLHRLDQPRRPRRVAAKDWAKPRARHAPQHLGPRDPWHRHDRRVGPITPEARISWRPWRLPLRNSPAPAKKTRRSRRS